MEVENTTAATIIQRLRGARTADPTTGRLTEDARYGEKNMRGTERNREEELWKNTASKLKKIEAQK